MAWAGVMGSLQQLLSPGSLEPFRGGVGQGGW